jgi:hypothetical protein
MFSKLSACLSRRKYAIHILRLGAGARDTRAHVIEVIEEGSAGTFVFQSTLNVDNSVFSVAYSPDGTKLAAGLGPPSYSVLIFDTQTNEQLC